MLLHLWHSALCSTVTVGADATANVWFLCCYISGIVHCAALQCPFIQRHCIQTLYSSLDRLGCYAEIQIIFGTVWKGCLKNITMGQYLYIF